MAQTQLLVDAFTSQKTVRETDVTQHSIIYITLHPEIVGSIILVSKPSIF